MYSPREDRNLYFKRCKHIEFRKVPSYRPMITQACWEIQTFMGNGKSLSSRDQSKQLAENGETGGRALLSSTSVCCSLCMNIRYQNSRVRTTYANAWRERYNKLHRTVCDNGNDAQSRQNVSELVRTSRSEIRLTR